MAQEPKPLSFKITADLMKMTVSVCHDCGVLVEGFRLRCTRCDKENNGLSKGEKFLIRCLIFWVGVLVGFLVMSLFKL